MMGPGFSEAPWTDDEVASLNAFQTCGWVHPFTGDNSESLIATREGWVAEEGGPIVQGWAHDWMANWKWQRSPLGSWRTP